MLVYDWEIFKHNSLLGVLDTDTNKIIQLWNISEIKNYINKNLNVVWIRL